MLADNPIQHETEAMETIPWVDMHAFLHGSPAEKLLTAQQFGSALQKIGFVAVTNIGLTPAVIDKAYAVAQTFFDLPEAIKRETITTDKLRGFVPFGTEHAKYTNVIDLKEFFHTTGPTQPDELWPSMPEFKTAMNRLYSELENCMKYCLQATAMYLGYQQTHEQTILSDLLGSGNGVMRILHYPPVDHRHIPMGAVRSAPHEDLGIMTVIPRATRPGLQVKTRQDQWLNVIVPKDAAIVNSGDVLSMLTNNIIPSTTHRVVNPDEDDQSHRYSIPFFGNLPFDTVLRVLDKCQGNTPEKDLMQPITFGDFLTERYIKIGLQ